MFSYVEETELQGLENQDPATNIYILFRYVEETELQGLENQDPATNFIVNTTQVGRKSPFYYNLSKGNSNT